MCDFVNNQPFFSIVLPIYNVEKYLDRCINSILRQDFDDYEIILVDDGSKDSCPALCDEWALKDERIKAVHKKNGGLGYARNTGLEHAKGKYIFFIDSDDYIMPGLLSAVSQEISKNQSDIVFYGFSRVDSQDNVLSQLIPFIEKDYYDNPAEIKNKLLPEFIAKSPHTGIASNLRISAWNCCTKIELFNKYRLRFPSEREYISEDLYFYMDLFNVLNKVSILKKDYYRYCQNQGSLTFTYKKDRYEKIKYCYESVEAKANEYQFDGEVQLRLKALFIANVLGCLKMEAGNTKNAGRKETYRRIKQIASDGYLVDALQKYPQTFYSRTWKVFRRCVLKKHFLFLYAFLSAQYRSKGV